jgi:hypothetical protein
MAHGARQPAPERRRAGDGSLEPVGSRAVTGTNAERYLLLGLRLGRHVDGMVDAYYGPPELAAAVQAEPKTDPAAIAASADQLLAELEDGWLRDQVLGVRTCAAFMAGEPGSYPDEVEGCYGVRPAHTDEAEFAAAHDQLDELLPGEGPLPERYERWRNSIVVPADRVEPTAAALIDEAREWTRGVVDLPEGEDVDLAAVTDQPWLAFCAYSGGLRSQISINVDLPISAFELLHVVCHETYPGHHAERVCKDEALVRRRGRLEETIVMVPTPQSLVSEGIAELGSELLMQSDGAARFTEVLGRAGIELDLPHALAVWRAMEPCRWAEVNVALMLHEHGAGQDEAKAYLQRWGLMTPDFAAHVIRFISAPTSRTYVINYSAGRDLCRSFVNGDPARFRHLLTEQVRVSDL